MCRFQVITQLQQITFIQFTYSFQFHDNAIVTNKVCSELLF